MKTLEVSPTEKKAPASGKGKKGGKKAAKQEPPKVGMILVLYGYLTRVIPNSLRLRRCLLRLKRMTGRAMKATNR